MDKPEWLNQKTVTWCAELIEEAARDRTSAGDCDGPYAKGELASADTLACRLYYTHNQPAAEG